MRNRIAFLCILLACAGCKLSGPAQTVENYYPFAVGNSWTYTSGDTTDSYTDTITGEFTDSLSIHWYQWGFTEDEDISAYIDGKVVFRSGADVIILKEPFEVGATWIYLAPDTSGVARIEDTKASVSTHAGEFENCIKVWYHYEDGDEDEEQVCYYAPGVGRVKVTTPGEDDIELYDYDLK